MARTQALTESEGFLKSMTAKGKMPTKGRETSIYQVTVPTVEQIKYAASFSSSFHLHLSGSSTTGESINNGINPILPLALK